MDDLGASPELQARVTVTDPSNAIPTAHSDEQQHLPEIKFAEWLPEPPADPVFFRRLKRIRWEIGTTAVVLAMIWAAALYCLATWKHAGALNILFQIFIPLSIMAWMYVRSRRAPPHLADLLDLPPVCPQFPVETTYRSKGVVYGEDLGIISLFDGWMHFQGRRTSWSLSTKELKKEHWTKQTGNSGVLAPVKTPAAMHSFRWTDGAEEFEVVLFPINQIDGLGGGLQKEFDETIRRWFDSQSAPSDTMMWPPTTAAPGVARRKYRVRKAWVAVRWISLALIAAGPIAYFGGPWSYAWAIGAVSCWLISEVILASLATSLAAVNHLSLEADRVNFQLPKHPWWKWINLKLT